MSAAAPPIGAMPQAATESTPTPLDRLRLLAAGRGGTIALIAFAVLFPWIDSALGLDLMNPALRILTSVMLALGLNIVVGYAGLLDLGYVAFWAIGAYVVGWFASGQFSTVNFHFLSGVQHTLPGVHISVWLLFIVAAFFTALFGVILGAPTLRLRGDYLAIVTLGFGEIVPKVFQNGDDIMGHNLTNGTRGIAGLDTPVLGGAAVEQALGPGWGIWGPINLQPWYYLGVALVVLCVYVSTQLQWSKLGRAWQAIREDEIAASAMGINLVRTKLWAYGIGAALGGVAGVYHGARIGSIFPASFQFYISISLLCMVIIGGMGNVRGAILGAFVIEGLNFWLLPKLSDVVNAVGVKVDLASWNLAIFGVLLAVTMLYRPQGFLPAKARIIKLDDEPIPDGVHAPHRDDHLVDEAHAGHADHFPSALHGPQTHFHPVLEVGDIPHPHIHEHVYSKAAANELRPSDEHPVAQQGIPRPRAAAPIIDAGPEPARRFPRFGDGPVPQRRSLSLRRSTIPRRPEDRPSAMLSVPTLRQQLTPEVGESDG